MMLTVPNAGGHSASSVIPAATRSTEGTNATVMTSARPRHHPSGSMLATSQVSPASPGNLATYTSSPRSTDTVILRPKPFALRAPA